MWTQSRRTPTHPVAYRLLRCLESIIKKGFAGDVCRMLCHESCLWTDAVAQCHSVAEGLARAAESLKAEDRMRSSLPEIEKTVQDPSRQHLRF